MSLDQSHLSCFTLLMCIMIPYAASKKISSCIIALIKGYVYKMLGINFAILLHLYVKISKIKNVINISSKFKMLTYNNQIFRNFAFMIICHLPKVSARIYKCIIFQPYELSYQYLLDVIKPPLPTVEFRHVLMKQTYLLFITIIISNLLLC